MAEFMIKVTDDERRALAKTICELNNLQHVSYMSRNMLAETSGIKANKVRVVLQDMIDTGEVRQFVVTKNRSLQRYYYTLSDAGKKLLQHKMP